MKRALLLSVMLLLSAAVARGSGTSVWLQPPDPEAQLHYRSYFKDYPLGSVAEPQAADDWRATDGRPISGMSWWGVFDTSDNRVTNLDLFDLRIDTDVAAVDNAPSHPSKGAVWSQWLTIADDVQDTLCHQGGGYEVHRYEVTFDESDWFYPEADNVYWVVIIGHFPTWEDNGLWMWHSALRPLVENGIGPAVQAPDQCPVANPMTGYPADWQALYDNDGAVGLAFELFTPIPEPTTLMLLGTGALGLVGVVRRRRINGAIG